MSSKQFQKFESENTTKLSTATFIYSKISVFLTKYLLTVLSDFQPKK